MTRHDITKRIAAVTMLALAVSPARSAVAGPSPGQTVVLGPFTGHYAPLHPDNVKPYRIAYYGTDLGWTYEHGGKLQILFGDTSATEEGQAIQASTGSAYDDGFGTIDLAAWRNRPPCSPDGATVRRLHRDPSPRLQGRRPRLHPAAVSTDPKADPRFACERRRCRPRRSRSRGP